MKKIILLIITIVLVGCTVSNTTYIPSDYIKKQEHYDSDSFKDYTDYCKYFYDGNVLKNNPNYKVVDSEDIDDIKGYFTNFEKIMKQMNRSKEYDFNINNINVGDYYVVINDGKSKYDEYTLYYFDIDSFILYYLHTNK